MKKAISYGRQTIEEDDVLAVVETLGSSMLTQGPAVEIFEEALRDYTGARYAICCSSGTAALHLACMAAGLGSGDGVVTSPITFLASANCALYVGATPFFADIDPETGNINPEEIEKAVSVNRNIKALIPVHFAGLPCDMESIGRIADRHKLTVIEDACHALGAGCKDGGGGWRKVGGCSYSDMTVFSFHPVKSITTGEGGAVTTNNKALYERLKLLRSHGVVRDRGAWASAGDSPWYYEMQELGYNYRMTDIQCALGGSQIKKIDRFVDRRNEIASLYGRLLQDSPFVSAPVVKEGMKSAFHLYPVRISFDEAGISKAGWFKSMNAHGVYPQVHYIPVHLQPYYRNRFGFKAGDFPFAEDFYRSEVSLPIYPLLADHEIDHVVKAVAASIAEAGRACEGV